MLALPQLNCPEAPLFVQLDPAALANLQDLYGDDAVGFRELVASFLGTAQVLQHQINAGLQSSDIKSIFRAAHTLRSSAALFGAAELAAACHQLEVQALQPPDWAVIERDAGVVLRLLDDAVTAIARLCHE